MIIGVFSMSLQAARTLLMRADEVTYSGGPIW